ncbi:hypothetical protein [Elioraea rosea]|uniref:hypothetical protein n=1 Tax=Elioraea rosea TaxID=2492390 RepID=UPI001182EE67|nr:hypothetical protein [Elioraea rosea]
MTNRSTWLNTVLAVDAASCAGLGALCLAAPGLLARLFGLPPALSLAAGGILLASAIVLVYAARSRPVPGWLLRLIVLGNGAWVAASVGVLALVPLSGLGIAFVIGQAVAVAAITVAEGCFLRAPAESVA